MPPRFFQSKSLKYPASNTLFLQVLTATYHAGFFRVNQPKCGGTAPFEFLFLYGPRFFGGLFQQVRGRHVKPTHDPLSPLLCQAR